MQPWEGVDSVMVGYSLWITWPGEARGDCGLNVDDIHAFNNRINMENQSGFVAVQSRQGPRAWRAGGLAVEVKPKTAALERDFGPRPGHAARLKLPG